MGEKRGLCELAEFEKRETVVKLLIPLLRDTSRQIESVFRTFVSRFRVTSDSKIFCTKKTYGMVLVHIAQYRTGTVQNKKKTIIPL